MKAIKVILKEHPYNIIVGSGITKFLGRYLRKMNIGSDAYIITNAFIKNKYGSALNRALELSGFRARFKCIPDTERSKSLETAFSVIKDIGDYDKKKRIFIIAFGGGVVGDLAGFIASIYKRGVSYIQVPTTLLAQVDSSIGGKTAVDLKQGKNLLGAFYQPRLVFSDVALLKTLDLRQVRNGLSEVIKYGIIKDRQLFSYLEHKYPGIFALNEDALEFIVWRSASIKARIVRQDEKEKKGIRTILNFGHTIGHAIETAGNYKAYNHGEAIALGMLAACGISQRLGLICDKTTQKIRDLIKKAGLPIKIEKIPLSGIIEAHYRDKKFIGPHNRFVLLKGLGKTVIKENIPLKVIKAVLRELT